MRVEKFQIKNFKAFGQTVTIPIKPITLIFGPNSSGKSSILQSLLLIKQSMGRAKCLVTKGDLVALGPFENVVYSNNKLKNLSFGFPFQTKDIDPLELASDYYKRIHQDFYDDKNIPPDFIKLIKILKSYQDICVTIDQESAGNSTKTNSLFLGENSQPLIQTNSTFFNKNHRFWRDYWETFDHEDKEELEQDVFNKYHFGWDLPENWFDNLDKLDPDDTDHQWILEVALELIKLGGFPRALFCYQDLFESSEDFDLIHKEGSLWVSNLMDRDPYLLFPVFGGYIESFIDRIKYIGPLRATPQQYYFPANPYGSIDYVGVTGENFPFMCTNSYDGVKLLNEELSHIGSENKVQIVKLTNRRFNLDDVFAIYLVNKKTKIKTNFFNTGFGFSQLLPILTQTTISQDDTILIEQPELHLHPAIQAELGDTFIRSALRRRDYSRGNPNNILIETHSEHLILRLLRRIRETSENRLPKHVPPITPDDIAVLYVQPGEKGSEVIEIPVTEDGEFERPWPQGFFPERARELF